MTEWSLVLRQRVPSQKLWKLDLGTNCQADVTLPCYCDVDCLRELPPHPCFPLSRKVNFVGNGALLLFPQENPKVVDLKGIFFRGKKAPDFVFSFLFSRME